MNKLMSLLFETNAFKIAEEKNPFWYTSGKIGPFFINAQFLYGSEEKSNDFLATIDSELQNESKENIPNHLFKIVLDNYNTDTIYNYVINEMINTIKTNINLDEIDYISGGERRDWYFSNIIAYLLKKPHVTCFKDLTTIESNYDFTENKVVTKIEGKNFLHVADLLNKGSSFPRQWIPCVENLGSKILWSLFAVNRCEEGTKVMEDCGIKVYSLLNLDDSLFMEARELNVINNEQLQILRDYKKDPDGSMKKFLINNPEFLQNALNSDNEKTKKRAKLLVEQNIYGLN